MLISTAALRATSSSSSSSISIEGRVIVVLADDAVEVDDMERLVMVLPASLDVEVDGGEMISHRGSSMRGLSGS